jgi:hypothetical protein
MTTHGHLAPSVGGHRTTSARRAAGVVVVVAALLCAVVVTRIGGSRAAGTATAPSGATLPSVGDCIETLDQSLTTALIAGGESSVAGFDESSVRFSHCAGRHVGEVVAFRSVPVSAAVAAATTAGADGDAEWCRTIAEQYAHHTIWRFRPAIDTGWEPSVGQRFIAVAGDAPHGRPGARWSTCAVLSSGLEPYEGSYMRSMSDAAAPPPFGRCRSGWAVDTWVSCLAPHRTQVFGTRQGSVAVDGAAVAGCRSLIQVMTGMSDITRSGALRVEIVPDESSLSCRLSIVGDVPMLGTLIGIGDDPLPVG